MLTSPIHRRFVKNEFFHSDINKHRVVSSDCETWYFIWDLNSPDLLPLAFLLDIRERSGNKYAKTHVEGFLTIVGSLQTSKKCSQVTSRQKLG